MPGPASTDTFGIGPGSSNTNKVSQNISGFIGNADARKLPSSSESAHDTCTLRTD